VQAIYVRPTTTQRLRPRRRLRIWTRRRTCRARFLGLGIYRQVDPLASTSRILDARIIGDEH